jgi:hypothetical protein
MLNLFLLKRSPTLIKFFMFLQRSLLLSFFNHKTERHYDVLRSGHHVSFASRNQKIRFLIKINLWNIIIMWCLVIIYSTTGFFYHFFKIFSDLFFSWFLSKPYQLIFSLFKFFVVFLKFCFEGFLLLLSV